MFEGDYFMRMIENMARALGQLIMHQRIDVVELFDKHGNVTAQGLVLHQLEHMIAQGQINEAENLLFEEIENAPNAELLPVAVEFYKNLAQLPKERLMECNYSAEEIVSGLQAVQRIFEQQGVENE